ncbi:P-loop NTPase fold protein [Pedobacter endophyticus]|uniref:KAP NTPase domain-containing protein n=1 Tax=Pedobacter endophyticus TaxID=2789740 RepID=A0A7U3Q5D9_9SPHI|nr:P-loop NTPase fold protein [Pedobacter endophyticus]QPH38892.1 hypothetical protein IZT61_17770 [Pedobacter endophyticus]
MSQKITTPEDRIGAQLRDYVYKESNLAVLLTGSWGSGKTHYIKSTFFPKLQEETSYRGFIISLFGINSIDDVKDRLMAELYPLVENKYIKAGSPIFKAIVKSIDVTKLFGQGIFDSGIEAIEKAGKELKTIKKEELDLSNVVICFDDLERSGTQFLSENQLLGYINGLTENGVRVIIVTDEKKLDQEKFNIVKEKVVGTTIHFQQNFEETFSAIIESLALDNAYLTFLRDHKNIIHDFLRKENQLHINYRTLKYFAVYFYDVCHFVQSGCENKELNNRIDDILDSLLKFSLCIAIEFKRGRLDFHENRKLNDTSQYLIRKMYADGKEKAEHIGEEILDDYFPQDDFYFYQSIYSYLTGGDIFDKNLLVEELKQKFHIVNENISDAYKTYNILAARDYLDLHDNIVKTEVRKMWKYALSGDYLNRDFTTVFYFIIRDGNILNLNIEKLASRFEKVLISNKNRQAYDPMLKRHLSYASEGEYAEPSNKIRKKAIEVNDQTLSKFQKITNKQIELDFVKDFDRFYGSMIEKIQQPFDVASLSAIRPNVFFNEFKKSENKKKHKILLLFSTLYLHQHINLEKKDYQFSLALDGIIKTYVDKNKQKNVSGALVLQLQESVKDHLNKARPYTGALE